MEKAEELGWDLGLRKEAMDARVLLDSPPRRLLLLVPLIVRLNGIPIFLLIPPEALPPARPPELSTLTSDGSATDPPSTDAFSFERAGSPPSERLLSLLFIFRSLNPAGFQVRASRGASE